MEELQIKKVIYMTTLGYFIAILVALIGPFFGVSIKFLFISALWLAISFLAYFIIKWKKMIKVVVFLNAIMAGMTLAAYYSDKEIDYLIILISILVFLLIIVTEYTLLIFAKNQSNIISRSTNISGIILFFWSLRWYGGDQIISSLMAFTFLVFFCMNIAVKKYIKRNLEFKVINVLQFSSMFMFGGILFLIIAILTEGDLFDIPGELFPDNKSKINNKPPSNV